LYSKTAPTKRPLTLDQFSEQYYKPEVVQRLQKAGRDTSIWALDKHIIPALGDMAISDITLRNLQELCDLKIKAGLSVQSVKHIKARLSAIFKHALGHRIIEGFNPATAIRLPKMTRFVTEKGFVAGTAPAWIPWPRRFLGRSIGRLCRRSRRTAAS
jgi:hypothetical protein